MFTQQISEAQIKNSSGPLGKYRSARPDLLRDAKYPHLQALSSACFSSLLAHAFRALHGFA
jgi:hypothetical protein